MNCSNKTEYYLTSRLDKLNDMMVSDYFTYFQKEHETEIVWELLKMALLTDSITTEKYIELNERFKKTILKMEESENESKRLSK